MIFERQSRPMLKPLRVQAFEQTQKLVVLEVVRIHKTLGFISKVPLINFTLLPSNVVPNKSQKYLRSPSMGICDVVLAGKLITSSP
jgi:hypothetical protein